MTRGGGTDRVLGKALAAGDAKSLGLPRHFTTVPSGRKGLNNPWRGAGNRRRNDLLSSVSGCGGTYRPKLKDGDTASLYYSLRQDDNLVTDASSKGHAIDLVLGSGQLGDEIESRIRGLCAGETMRYASNDGILIVHVAYIGKLGVQNERLQRLEKLSHIIKSLRASKGVSCELACRRKGLICAQDGFKIINTCPRLKQAYPCRSCETAAAGSSGPDMPCYVEISAPVGHPRGSCMVNPKITSATCKAKYRHTRRLCPCIPRGET
ncbi:unnamed protein product [Chondrus crispus]|uniref:Uncharacterized protein n=1 Tax=Chondrus crispus TaxID=2769 RepID=R7QM86_CHOCR|nr:unnamed protein product [Chondrus crispus]CDF38591.1 unnamed protein product [Chondrus crispus]|eukprot:XP_005718496.1 unnamed protein product [Chondrus crispus]